MAGRHDDGFDLNDHSLRARLFKISSEQQSLLSRDNVWSLSPSNIPDAVLAHVTAHLARQRAAKTATNAAEQQTTEPPPAPPPPLSLPRSSPPIERLERFDSQPPESPAGLDQDDEQEHQYDESEELPGVHWTPSPPHHMHPPVHVANTTRDDFLTQLPEETPPQPTAFRSTKISPRNYDFPPSSMDHDEDELEIDIPTRVENPAVARTRAAVQVMATPPSAQVVPCSLEPVEVRVPEPARLKSRGGPRQTRYAPVATLYRPAKSAEPAEPAVNSTCEPSKLSASSGDHSQPNTFPSDTSSSIIPSTQQAPSLEQHPPPSHLELDATATDSQDSPRVPKATAGSNIAALEFPAPKNTPTQSGRHSIAPPTKAQALPELVREAPPPAHVQDTVEDHGMPYDHFCSTYKDYKGDVLAFVTACIYIQLQHKKIRSSLYDDFVRAWHQSYFAYVKSCDDAVPPQTPMHAYAWYNEMDDDPVYTARIITKQNLEATMDFYPHEVKIARRSLRVAQEEKPDSSRLQTKPSAVRQPSEEVSRLASPPITVKPAAVDAARNDDHVQDIHVADTGSPPDINFDESPIAVNHTDFSKSMSELVPHRQQPAARTFTRSRSEVFKHKRKASMETTGRQAKRRPLPTVNTISKKAPPPPSPSQVSIRPRNLHRSPAASVASVDFQTPSSTDMRRRRFDDDPEKRKEHFRQYLLKRKQSTANEAIMSSAPTSAQRH